MRNKLPFQMFPSSSNSIDDPHLDRTAPAPFRIEPEMHLPIWMEQNGIHGKAVGWLHRSRFFKHETEHGILLTGMPHEILRADNGNLVILDYQWCMDTDAQDALLPIYDVRLNTYARIVDALGIGKVERLFIINYWPKNDVRPIHVSDDIIYGWFTKHFGLRIVPVELQPDVIPPLLRKIREIFDAPSAPSEQNGCNNCEALTRIEKHYGAILGFHGEVSTGDIETFYRQKVAQYHPDEVARLDPKRRATAQAEMRDINSAYKYFQRKHGI